MEKDSTSQSQLTRYLIVKSIIELLFVSALAVGFYLTAFAPFFRGSLDAADARNVAGWVVNHIDPNVRVEVQLYIDGKFVADGKADTPRPDLTAAGRAVEEHHGFVFETPLLPIGEHEARVFAVHSSGGGNRRTLQLIGTPLLFSVTAGDQRGARSTSEQP